mgnify:CR=1 FL=1
MVVLGASVYADGTPSDILADRLEVACDLYKSGAARAIIVSGDKDLKQCLGPNVYMWDPASKEEKLVSEADFTAESGVLL